MKKLLIFPLSLLICLGLVMPVQAQTSYQLLFSYNGFTIRAKQKVGRYYFSHDANERLLYGTNKKHLKVLEKYSTYELLTNGTTAYYIRDNASKNCHDPYELVQVNLSNAKKTVRWTSEATYGDMVTDTLLGAKGQKLYFYFEYRKVYLGTFDMSTHQVTYKNASHPFIYGNGDFFTGIKFYPSDIAITNIYLYNSQLKKTTLLTKSTVLFTKLVGNDLYYDQTTLKKGKYTHKFMKYNLKTHKRTSYRSMICDWNHENSLRIINYSKKAVTIQYTDSNKVKQIALKGKTFTLK